MIFSTANPPADTIGCRSAAKLTYGEAQTLLDNKVANSSIFKSNEDEFGIREDISLLYGLAMQLRGRRFSNGVLDISGDRLEFDLDVNGLPTDCGYRQREETSKMVEEVHLSSRL